MEHKKRLTGGEFLIHETNADNVFTPEEFNEEQQMILQTCKDFLDSEVFPILDRIDNQEEGLMRGLLHKSGDLGLLGVSLPVEYGGFDQSFVTSMLASEAMGSGYSFSVAYSAHTGIGTLPILYYGNEDQKARYLPKLASGEWAAAYCLTEPNAGSDANAGKSKAVLSDDGTHFILNGQKMWITNGGFADLLTVFAKIGCDRVHSAFIVERNWPGVVILPEEKKMGIKGSSTVQIFFNDVKVPVGNLLGKQGEGFRIALNILHMGRIKLGGTALGAAKRDVTLSVKYANERKQFGRLIGSFGAIKYKLAEQLIKTFTTESAVYRASHNVDEAISELMAEGIEKTKATVDGIAQYAIEAAILKVYGSEALNYIVDEAVQIFGGMGFSSETNADRAYRDSRINRIFEGTNEINRLLVADTTIKKALRVGFDVVRYANHVVKEWKEMVEENPAPLSYYDEKRHYIKNFKRIALFLLGAVSEKFERNLVEEQMILFDISDIIMNIYAAESTMLRVEKTEKLSKSLNIDLYKDILDVFIYDTAHLINKAASDAVNSFASGKEQQIMLHRIRRFTELAPVNVKEARIRLANKIIEENKYPF